MELKCAICEKEFEAIRPNQKYCCQECKREAWRRKNLKEAKERKCVICGAGYFSARENKLTCSSECSKKLQNKRSVQYQKAKREKERALGGRPKETTKKPKTTFKERRWVKKVYPPKECARCGKVFTPSCPANRYCSLACSNPSLAKKYEPKPLTGLALDNYLAREQGLTYGQWRGLQILKELKEK
jgi:hypothetical protein